MRTCLNYLLADCLMGYIYNNKFRALGKRRAAKPFHNHTMTRAKFYGRVKLLIKSYIPSG